MLEGLVKDFEKVFGDAQHVRAFFAPGRVNLIGEHTDYNGGHVFPCALSVGTYAIARKRDDREVNMYSKNFPDAGIINFQLDHLVYDEKDNWANYPKGVIREFVKNGHDSDAGLDVLFFGNIPNGAGLSSSASIELVTSVLLKALFSLQVEMVEMVKMSQKAENEFMKVNCGIMDQFSIGMGRADHALLLDCNTLSYTYSPIHLKDATLVIGNTNKRRGLADSKYNERRTECEQALKEIQEHHSIQSLGDLTPSQFEEVKHHLSNDVIKRRAKHAVYENDRTKEAVHLLEMGDIKGFGQLMNDSHRSLRDDYEVTGRELDALVEAAWNQQGTIGARMTGAGFGGCTVNLVENAHLDEFLKNVKGQYEKATGLVPEFYTVEIGDGAREMNMD
ncbi:galactokinase [Sutcliffiella horikoshii]|uniref:galactokinase n=1 Tax=Sutcliffiella horikoshii TaxID=79883 RepID=UPI00203A50BF|nr:galactokinase [Sutcliffiella horikoshii]MCM3620170.1 galactokinase [Sutcliffiella horikoshii]